jgi:UDP-3-O-[3-hydroxymyristoyl] glucosamine N-acyltransferase
VPARTQVAGIPAVEMRRWRRQTALLSRLEQMNKRLRALERKLAAVSGDPDGAASDGEE